jgi:6-O-methylguanine DNA methyltransferase, DNA binding domain
MVQKSSKQTAKRVPGPKSKAKAKRPAPPATKRLAERNGQHITKKTTAKQAALPKSKPATKPAKPKPTVVAKPPRAAEPTKNGVAPKPTKPSVPATSPRPGATKVTWKEKLEFSKGLPKVVPILPTHARQWGQGTMVVPAPREVDAIMKQIPEGKLITIVEIRRILARRHGATIGCPLTVGIFAWIAANAADDDLRARRPDATPYWRTLKTGGFLNEKYPGGIEAHREKLEAEGFEIIEHGSKLLVADYQEYITIPGDKPKRR